MVVLMLLLMLMLMLVLVLMLMQMLVVWVVVVDGEAKGVGINTSCGCGSGAGGGARAGAGAVFFVLRLRSVPRLLVIEKLLGPRGYVVDPDSQRMVQVLIGLIIPRIIGRVLGLLGRGRGRVWLMGEVGRGGGRRLVRLVAVVVDDGGGRRLIRFVEVDDGGGFCRLAALRVVGELVGGSRARGPRGHGWSSASSRRSWRSSSPVLLVRIPQHP